jgi:hypothetical protein
VWLTLPVEEADRAERTLTNGTRFKRVYTARSRPADPCVEQAFATRVINER